MCLILFAWQTHSEYPLIVAANRDEFYARRTRAASWWGQAVSLLAGRDEEAGGTWLGINRRGRFAVVTNVRAPNERNPHATSRGLLVLSALQTSQPMREWIDDCLSRAHTFNGFNLIVAEPVALGSRGAGAELAYISNRVGDPVRRLRPELYGPSNSTVDTPRPKRPPAASAFACPRGARAAVDRYSSRLGTGAIGNSDSRQRVRHAGHHDLDGPARRAGWLRRALVRRGEPG